MPGTTPCVSIIIPVYNGDNFLREAINSALAQSYPNIEVIVVNDGSTDGGATESMALSYGDAIRYFSKPNGGVSTALNMGIENMSGEFFCWLSHDDMYTADKVEKQMAALIKFGRTAIVYSDYHYVSETGQLNRTMHVSPKAETNMRALLAISQQIGVHGCSMLIPRIFFQQVGLFDPQLRYTQDVDFWFRLAQTGVPFLAVKEALVISRVHEQQDTQRYSTGLRNEYNVLAGKMIGQLSFDEVEDYVDGNNDLLIAYAQGYVREGYDIIAGQLLKQICLMAEKYQRWNTATAMLLDELVLQSGNWKAARKFWDAVLLPCIQSAKQKPRIVLLGWNWNHSSTKRMLTAVIQFLQHRFEWILVTNDDAQEVLPSGLQVRIVRLSTETELAARLISILQMLDADLFIGGSNPGYSLYPIYEKLRKTDIRTIVCEPDDYFSPFRLRQYQAVAKRTEAYGLADAVVWLTAFSANVYARLQPNAAVLPPPNTVLEQEPVSYNDRAILAVGPFHEQFHRLDRIVVMFAKVLARKPDAELHIVGKLDLKLPVRPGSSETINDLIDQLKLPRNQLHFASERDDAAPHYKFASVVVSSSISEGSRLVLHEAGAFGIPCVMLENAGLEEAFVDGRNGFVVPRDDLDLFASRVALLLTNKELRRQMSKTALEMSQRYEADRSCPQWESLINAVLTTDNRKELNRLLAEQFMEPVQNIAHFTRQTAQEYERGLEMFI